MNAQCAGKPVACDANALRRIAQNLRPPLEKTANPDYLSFIMKAKGKSKERDLRAEASAQVAWRRIAPGSELRSASGESIRILSPGVWNHAAGPDFLGARIERNGRIAEGAVEIHVRASDWLRHGHAEDPRYRGVILHVVRDNDATPGDAPFLPDVPTIVLPDDAVADEAGSTRSPAAAASGRKGRGVLRAACAPRFAAMSDAELRSFVQDAGLDRLALKMRAFSENAIAAGFRKAFLRALLDWLGVPENRASFKELFQRLCLYSDDVLEAHFEAILWGESGLLPDPSSKPPVAPDARDAVTALWDEWWSLRPRSTDRIAFSRSCRPLNSPERRLAVVCRWKKSFGLDPWSELIRLVGSCPGEELPSRLAERLDASEDFWTWRTSFRSSRLKERRALFGAGRLNGMLADVIAPALSAYAELKRDPALAGAVRDLYCSLPPSQDNSIVRLIDETCLNGRLKRPRSAAEQQGMLHLYKRHCSPHCFDCSVCELHRSFSG